jgi:hypothetical protein
MDLNPFPPYLDGYFVSFRSFTFGFLLLSFIIVSRLPYRFRFFINPLSVSRLPYRFRFFINPLSGCTRRDGLPNLTGSIALVLGEGMSYAPPIERIHKDKGPL